MWFMTASMVLLYCEYWYSPLVFKCSNWIYDYFPKTEIILKILATGNTGHNIYIRFFILISFIFFSIIITKHLFRRKLVEGTLYNLVNVLQYSKDAVIVQNREGQIIEWNQRAEQLYGWKREEVLSMNVEKIIPFKHRKQELTYISTVQSERLLDFFESQRLTRDDRKIDVWLTLVRLA